MNEQDVISINPEESLYLAVASAYRLDLNGAQPTFNGTITLERERTMKAIERYKNQILDEAIEAVQDELDACGDVVGRLIELKTPGEVE